MREYVPGLQRERHDVVDITDHATDGNREFKPAETHVVDVHLSNGFAGSTVSIDGHVIPKVRDIRIRHEVGQLPTVQIEVIGCEVRIDGEIVNIKVESAL